ncbi:MAG: hypothetical protein KGL59_02165 [Acidobacteriota bacterium]|nr:hypothetical protein [Acidobacteriota bacterium]
MTKRLLAAAIAVFFVAGLSFAAGNKAQKAKMETLTGVITDTHCGANGHMGSADACVKKCIGMGAKYALAVGKKVYVLDPQEMAAEHPGGAEVRVKGTVEGDTIHASSIAAVKK